MPCHDPRDDYDKEHNNVAAGLLCELCKKIPLQSELWTRELMSWWIDHQDRDAYNDRKSKERR